MFQQHQAVQFCLAARDHDTMQQTETCNSLQHQISSASHDTPCAGHTTTGPESFVKHFNPSTREVKHCNSAPQYNAAMQAAFTVKIDDQEDKSAFGLICGSSVHHNGQYEQRTLKRAAGARFGSISGNDISSGIGFQG